MTAEKPPPESELSSVARRSRWTKWSIWLALSLLGVIVAINIIATRPSDDTLRRQASEFAAAAQWREVAKTLQRLQEPTTDDLLSRASAYLTIDDLAHASSDLDRIPQNGPGAARRSFLIGQLEKARHHARPMEENLRKAVELDPKLTPARRLLVYLYGLQERRPELREQFAELANRGPLTVDIVLHWCLSRGPIGDPAETRSDLIKFVAADPKDRNSRLALADVNRRLGKLDEALKTLEPLPADDTDAIATRAQIEFDRGDNTQGDAILAKAPNEHPRLDRLRGRRALARRDGPAAVKFLKSSDAADPDNQETLFTLAQALRLDGKKEVADQIAARAAAHQALRAALVEFSQGNDARSETFRKLGAACESVGFMSEAKAWYHLAVSADPLNREAQKAIFRLK